MPYTILFVTALICVSGFIAYFGDLLGRRMGKKRLTLFNLRPRYTAIVVTTITGMLISTLALTTLVSVNSQFRKVLLRGEQILAQNKKLSSTNTRLALRQIELRKQVEEQRKALVSARKDAIEANKARARAVKVVAGLRLEIALRQKELASLQKRTDIAEAELKQKKRDLALMQIQLDNAEHALRLAQTQLVSSNKKLAESEAKLKDTNTKLKEAQVAFNQLSVIGETATDFAFAMRNNELAYRQGDEIARGIIHPAQSAFAIKGDLYSLLEYASDKAAEGGAKAGSNGRSVTVIFRMMTDKGPDTLGESDCVGMAIRKIASADQDVLVQVVCAMNTLTGSQVPVELRLYLNNAVIKQGGKIADIKIDGKQSDGYILLALNSFLQTEVAKAAVQAGVVPLSGRDARASLGPNRQAQADELLRLVDKIRAMNAMTDVSVYATSDIRAGDTLNMDNIRFNIAKAE